MSYIYDLSDTWNAAGTTFYAIKMNVTNTASAAASRLISLQVGGTEQFFVRKDGYGYFAGFVGVGTSNPSSRLNTVGHNEFSLGFTAQTDSTQTALASHPVSALANTDPTVGNGLGIRYQIADTGSTLRTAGGIGMVSTAKTASTVTADMYFLTGTTERMRLTSAGNLAIGTTSANGKVHIYGTSPRPIVEGSGNGNYATWKYISKSSAGAVVNFEQGVGIAADNAFETYDNQNTQLVSRYISGASGYWSWFTNGSERLRIDSSGNVVVTGAGGLGYGTGSGGAVTQATSRTTGVTLNKTNGAITLVSAAGSTSWQSFTVTNSTVAASDVVHVCQKSGTDLYEIHVTAVAAGSFRISYKTTGGTTTEQPVFNFAVIKAVTA